MRIRPNYVKQISHDADHPYEREVVRLCANYLEKVQWPIERIGVRIAFGFKTRLASDHKIELSRVEGYPVGQAELFYNALFIQQDCSTFFIHIVPHEIAHILDEVNIFKFNKGEKVEKHGEGWIQWLQSLSNRASTDPTGPEKIFDDRAIRLHSGGIPCRCQCKGDAGFHVVSKRSQRKLQDPGIACRMCNTYIKPVGMNETPIIINQQIDYIRDQLCRR